jgi:hypothetical protein
VRLTDHLISFKVPELKYNNSLYFFSGGGAVATAASTSSTPMPARFHQLGLWFLYQRPSSVIDSL